MLEYIGWDVSVQMGLLFTCLDNQEKSGFWENEKDEQCLFLYCIFTFVLFLLFLPGWKWNIDHSGPNLMKVFNNK